MAVTTRQPVSGRYRGRNARFEVQLRIDVDGARPMGAVSADYTRLSDGTPVGSMRIDAPTVTATASVVTITGPAEFSWQTTQRTVSIAIERAAMGGAPGTAKLQHAGPGGRVGSRYSCVFESPAFRTVQLEEACEVGIKKFVSYDTGALPAGAPAQSLSHVASYAAAGIEMQTSRPTEMVDTSAAGADAAWSDAEMQAAMVTHFTRWADGEQWAVWLLHANRHDSDALAGPNDPKLQGLMFDRSGDQRQGCAIFYDAMAGDSAVSRRSQLYTCVHELGHTFNLVHCWQGNMAKPPVPSRPDAASWMNYPYLYPGGEDAYWPAFAFAFDEPELTHLRHGFRDDVIMGGAPFLSDAALMSAPARDGVRAGEHDPNLQLKLHVAPVYGYGVPVTADLELSTTAPEGRHVAPVLGPRPGTVDIAIARAGHEPVVFAPLLRHCRGGSTVLLRPNDGPIRDAAFLHYGRDGYPFREPGLYDVQARYAGVDGSVVRSDVARLRIDRPRSVADRAIGASTYGDGQVGTLLSLMGSDAAYLDGGNRALQQIITRFPTHPMAAISRLVTAANAARTFKTVSGPGRVGLRTSDVARARALVDPIIPVGLVRMAASGIGGGAPTAHALSAALRAVGTRDGVDTMVDRFIRSRSREILVAATSVLGSGASPRVRRPVTVARRPRRPRPYGYGK